MLKYLLVLAVVVLVLWAVRRASLPPPPPKPPRPPEAPKQLESMVRCSHCGLHLPRGEALAGPDGHLYCSPAHRAAGPRRT